MDVTAARLAFQEIHKLKDRLHLENLVLRVVIDRSSMFEEIAGSSPALKTVLRISSKSFLPTLRC
jgi:hypothetical protein